MPPVEIYTTPFCGYCHMAKRLLKGKGIAFSETNVLLNPSLRIVMAQRAAGGARCRRFSSARPMWGAATSSMRWSAPASSTRCSRPDEWTSAPP